MSVIEVRSADDGDVETMAAIYINAAREGWAHIFGESGLEALEPPVERFRAELASTDPRRQVLVAEREGRVIGFAVVRPSRDGNEGAVRVGELDQLYSDPAVWGQGGPNAPGGGDRDASRERLRRGNSLGGGRQPSSETDL